MITISYNIQANHVSREVYCAQQMALCIVLFCIVVCYNKKYGIILQPVAFLCQFPIRKCKDYIYGIWVYKVHGLWKVYYRVKKSLVSSYGMSSYKLDASFVHYPLTLAVMRPHCSFLKFRPLTYFDVMSKIIVLMFSHLLCRCCWFRHNRQWMSDHP